MSIPSPATGAPAGQSGRIGLSIVQGVILVLALAASIVLSPWWLVLALPLALNNVVRGFLAIVARGPAAGPILLIAGNLLLPAATIVLLLAG